MKQALYTSFLALALSLAGSASLRAGTGNPSSATASIELPALQYDRTVGGDTPTMLDVRGRWASDRFYLDNNYYCILTGHEMWIIDFERQGGKLRPMLTEHSFIASNYNVPGYQVSIPSRLANLSELSENHIKFSFVITRRYVPQNTGGGLWWKLLEGIGLGFWGDLAVGIGSQMARAQQLNEMIKANVLYSYYYEIELDLDDNRMDGWLTTIISETQPNGTLSELTNRVDEFSLFRVTDDYKGAQQVYPTNPKKKQTNPALVSILKAEGTKAKNGDAEALNNLGFMYLNGLGTKVNYKKATQCFSAAAGKNNAMATYNLAQTYMHMPKAPANPAKDTAAVREWLKKAADMDQQEAIIALAWYYLYGGSWGIVKDEDKALALLERGILLGSEKSMSILGWAYLNGIGVEQNYEEAVKWFERAIEAGSVGALAHLGDMYRYGLGVGQDPERALGLFLEAARQGNTRAIYHVASTYYWGDLMPMNYIEGKKWVNLGRVLDINAPKGLSTTGITANDLVNLKEPAPDNNMD